MEEIETILLAALIRNDNFLSKTIMYFDESIFEQEKHKQIFKYINILYTKTGIQPSYAAVYHDSLNDNKLTDDNRKDVKDVLDIIEEINLPDDEWLLKRAEDFIKRQKIHQALVESIAIFEGDNKKQQIEAVPEILRQAISVSFDNKVGISYLKDAERRFDYYTNPEFKVPCGLITIDDRTGGGVTKQSLNVVMGSTGIGKTLTLVSLSSNYARLGMNVLYISCELREEEIQKRLDANILNIDMSELPNIDKTNFINAVMKIRQKSYGDIVVKSYAPNTCSTNHIRKLINDLKVKDKFKPDILITDYLGLMASSILSKSSVKEFQYLKSISEELRGICVDMDMVGWTALQTNRNADKKESDLSDVAASYDVTHGLDYVLSIWRTPESDNAGFIYAKETKSRYGNAIDCPQLRLGVDLYKQRLFDFSEQSVNDVNARRHIDEMRKRSNGEVKAIAAKSGKYSDFK